MRNKEPKDETKFFVVEEGIPIPAPRSFMKGRAGHQKRNEYPFKDLRIGDSFRVPGTRQQRAVYQAAGSWAKRRELEWKFLVRRMDDGHYRLWRTE